MNPLDFACVSEFLQLLHGLFGMLFLVGEDEDLGGVVLEEMSNDAIPYACGTASDNVDLH